MKRNEVIELNGVEYTLELNRDSFLQIDKICNIQKCFELIKSNPYEYIEEIDDNYNPLENMITDEDLEKSIEDKEKALHNITEKAFFIWLYPNHKLTISEVKNILKPYFDDVEKSQYISEKLGYCLQECISMREAYNQERKNLKAQINK